MYHIHSFSGSAQLFVSPYPKGKDVFDLWKQKGVSLVVSLLTRQDQIQLNLQEEEKQLEKNGIRLINFEIQDFGVPSSAPVFNTLLHSLDQEIDSGASMLIHCRAGQGRSGLLAIAILMRRGMSVEEAIELFSKARACKWPESDVQKSFLETLMPE